MSEQPPEGNADRKLCLVCGRILDYWEGPGGGWRHSIATQDPEETDHPPIPVSVEEASEQLRERCDFCYADEAPYALPVRTFTNPGAGSVSVGDWAACELCAREIEKNAWNRLYERALAGFIARHGPVNARVEADLKRMYRTLRKNITGPIHRAGEGE